MDTHKTSQEVSDKNNSYFDGYWSPNLFARGRIIARDAKLRKVTFRCRLTDYMIRGSRPSISR